MQTHSLWILLVNDARPVGCEPEIGHASPHLMHTQSLEMLLPPLPCAIGTSIEEHRAVISVEESRNRARLLAVDWAKLNTDGDVIYEGNPYMDGGGGVGCHARSYGDGHLFYFFLTTHS